MRFHKQLSAHIPQIGMEGDCYRTALACILDMEPNDVPHFMQLFPPGPTRDALHPAVEEWLRQRGYSKIDIPYHVDGHLPVETLREIIAAQNGEDLLYLLTGLSNFENQHVVICRGSKVLWDPSPADVGVTMPIDGFFFVTHLIPSSMRLRDDALQLLIGE